MTKEADDLLRQATEEIRMLRRINEIQAARLDTLDVIAAIVRPNRGGCGSAPDVVWAIDRYFAERHDAAPAPEGCAT